MRRLVLTATLAAGAAFAPAAAGKGKKNLASFSADYASAPSYRYGAMSRAECHKELERRKVRYTKVANARGVLAPVRILGGVGGVVYRTLLPEKQRASSPWEVFDCRLVLALHDLSAVLKARGIDEVIMFSAWRPPAKSWPDGKLARRHPGALAIDIKSLRKRGEAGDEWLSVEQHFNGRIGDETCGPKAVPPSPKTPQAEELRSLVCELAEKRIFTSMLTPNYDKAHFNHFHFEITPEVKWQLVR